MTNKSLETLFWTLAFIRSVLSIAGVPVMNPIRTIIDILIILIVGVQVIRWWRSRRHQH